MEKRRVSGRAGPLSGPGSSLLGSETARGGEGCCCCNPRGGWETPEGKGLEVNARVVITENQCADPVRVWSSQASGCRCTGGPAKPLHCSHSWGACGPLKPPCSPRSSSPLPSHRGHLSYLQAMLELMLETLGVGAKKQQLSVGCAWADLEGP